MEAADRRAAGVIQANLAIAPSNPNVALRVVAGRRRAAAARPASSASTSPPTAASTGSTRDPRPERAGRTARRTRGRSRASAAAICRRSPSIRRNANVVYSASTVIWRTEDGGADVVARCAARPAATTTRSIWINPNNPNIILVVADQGAVVSANRGVVVEQLVHPAHRPRCITSPTDNAFPYRVCGGQQDSGSACVDSRSDDGEITFHDWHPVNIQEYGMAAPDPKDPDIVYGSARTNVSLLQPAHRPDHAASGPTRQARCPSGGAFEPQRAHDADPVVAGRPDDAVLRVERRVEDASITVTAGRASAPISTRQTWAVPANAGKYASTRDARRRWAASPRSRRRPRASTMHLGRHRRRQHPGDDATAARSGRTSRRPRSSRGRASSTSRRATSIRCTAYAAANTLRIDDIESALLAHARRRQDVDRDQHRHRAGRRRQLDPRGSAAEGTALRRRPTRRCGCRSTTAITGSRCGSTCRRSRCATSR